MAEFDIERYLKLPPENISSILETKKDDIWKLVSSLSDDEHYNRFFAIRHGREGVSCFHCQDFMSKTLPVRHLLILAYDKQTEALAGFNDVYITDKRSAIISGIVSKNYRNLGLGARLNQECFDTIKEVPGIEIIEMDILYSNQNALHLAEKLSLIYTASKTHEFGVVSYKFRLTQVPK